MEIQCVRIADLEESQVRKVQDLESELGVVVLVFRPGCQWADLNREQLEKLQSVEKDLGMILLAYKPSQTATSLP